MSKDATGRKLSPGPWSWGAGAGKWVLVDANDKRMLSFSEWSIERGDMPLIAAAPEMAAMLRELEWSVKDGPGVCCPMCLAFAMKPAPGLIHNNGCRLAALLEAIGRAP